MPKLPILLFATVASLAAPLATAPVAAQVAASEAAGAAQFVLQTSGNAFAVLRDKSVSKSAARSRFREMLKGNFALEEIGNRLIRRQRAGVTPAQLSAYHKALPTFVINVYSDRLYDYSGAEVKVVRTMDRAPGVTDVYSKVLQPSGHALDAIWQIRKLPTGQYQILNLTVSGINIAMTQEADFSAYVARNGFDRLIEFMSGANARAGI